MSMLAERKRKQKWCLNPRGKEWSQDANKFGQKMLEKMGWQHGKGLGANESGITEHIKISYKNDSKGMGYKESNDQWTEHETNFSALLGSLTGETADPAQVKVNSLEKKSQSSRARVHYHKFTRGKDLSRYSEKDLANIFGKKSLKEVKPVAPSEPEQEETDQKENESGFLRNAGSMRDYFKKKLPGFGKSNGFMLGNNGVLKKAEDSESEGETRPSFGFGFKGENATQEQDKTTFVSYIKEEQSTKRKAQETIEEEMVFSPMKKSKKEKKQKVPEDENLGISNPSFNPLGTPLQIQKHKLEPIEESVSEEFVEDTPKKSKKKKDMSCNEGVFEEGTGEMPEETPKKNKNKKSLSVEGSVEENIVETPKKKKKSDNCLQSEVEHSSASSKKRKTVEAEVAGFFNPVCEEIGEESVCLEVAENPYEVKVKKKKKKNRNPESSEDTVEDTKNKNQSHFENPTFEDTEENLDQIEAEENPYEVKRKTKKKKHKKSTVDVESPTADDTEASSQVSNPSEEALTEIKIKRKKKKKSRSDLDNAEENSVDSLERNDRGKRKKKTASLAIDNPSFQKRFNECEENSTDSSQIEGNANETREKKKKKTSKKQPLADSTDVNTEAVTTNPYEVKTKKKNKISKKQSSSDDADNVPNGHTETGIENPALRLNDSTDNSLMVEDCDLMLNIVATPVRKEERPPTVPGSLRSTDSVRRRKSVRFSDVNQERIIPSKEEMRELYQEEAEPRMILGQGVDNVNFDRQQVSLEENLDSISKTLDSFQAEIDNDINEEKMKTLTLEELMVGEVGNPHGKNEKVPGGSRLKFKHDTLGPKTPMYHLNQNGPKKSYKHLIKGDILVMFDGTNLHELEGYGARTKSEEV